MAGSMKILAAICIGSYEMELKLFEIKKNGRKELCCARQRLELGRDTFRYGKLENATVRRLCEVLARFQETMKEYPVDSVKICATTAVREAENLPVVLEQIRLITGLEPLVLSNSEQRFLGYKAIALNIQGFSELIQTGTAVLEAGSGSLQISLFQEGRFLITQNIPLAAQRLKERLERKDYSYGQLEEFIKELAGYRLGEFWRYYLANHPVQQVILFGEGARAFAKDSTDGLCILKSAEFLERCRGDRQRLPEFIEQGLGGAENGEMLVAAGIIYESFLTMTGAKKVLIPGIDLNDGLCYEYLQEKGLLEKEHNFEEDILDAAWNMADRYQCDRSHSSLVLKISLLLFDELRKKYGLTKRDRLLLELSAILHDCGKFMSIAKAAECTYNIILASEIIGLSHKERELVAAIIRQSAAGRESAVAPEFELEEERVHGIIQNREEMPMHDYIRIRKLAALLCVADAMDISHCQKVVGIRLKTEQEELKVTVKTKQDYRLERNLFHEAAGQFEEIYQLKPVLVWKRENS